MHTSRKKAKKELTKTKEQQQQQKKQKQMKNNKCGAKKAFLNFLRLKHQSNYFLNYRTTT